MMNQLAMLEFAAPWMAWGAAAAIGLPLLAHLLSKTRYREAVFPATRLVQQAVAATSRIESPRHRLLMLLRWLVLVLLVIAFMRPQWTLQAEAGGQDRGIALVLLIDSSASMQRTTDGATLYNRALREAEQLLGELDPARDVAAVIRVDHAPVSLLPGLTARLSLITERLSSLEAGNTHANWQSAIAAAQRLTQDERHTVRVVTLSDQQGERPSINVPLADLPFTGIDHIRINGSTGNVAVRLVDVYPYPAVAGQPMTATFELRNFNDRPASVSLTCQFDPIRVKRQLTLQPNASERVALTLPSASGQRELIQLTLDQNDVLAADNIAGLVVPVQETTTSLIIHDPDTVSQARAARLATLINPGEVERMALPVVELLTVDQAEAAIKATNPGSLRTVMLLNQAPLPDGVSQALEAFAQAGGGVVQFAMDETADATRKTTAAGIDFEIEPLQIFEGPARAGLASLAWPGVGNAAIAPRATPILMDKLERVMVAELPRGRGRLIAINAVLDPEPGGLLAEPAFVVLFNELCRYASPGVAIPTSARPGDPLPPSLLRADQLRVALDADPEASVFTAPGPYAGMDASGFIEELIFAELDPAESDTRTPDVWSDDANARQSTNATTGSTDAVASSLRTDPIELWPYLVVAVLCLVACESFLLHRFSGPRQPTLQGGAA